MNIACIVGNLGRDPEVRDAGGSTVCEFSVAVNEKFTNRSGDLVEKVHWFDVVTWGKQAEVCGKYLFKGSKVGVQGALQYEQWETDGGTKRSRVKIRADRVDFLTPKDGNGGGARREESEDIPFGGARPAGPAADADDSIPF